MQIKVKFKQTTMTVFISNLWGRLHESFFSPSVPFIFSVKLTTVIPFLLPQSNFLQFYSCHCPSIDYDSVTPNQHTTLDIHTCASHPSLMFGMLTNTDIFIHAYLQYYASFSNLDVTPNTKY